jgi:transposase, IS30 family
MARHLSMEERKRISELRAAGYSPEEMAHALGRHRTSITRELKRNRQGCLYCPQLAQQKAEERRRQRSLVRKMDRPEIRDQVRDGLAQYHSPDQIAGRMKRLTTDPRQRVSSPTIYAWIRRQEPDWERYLRRYGRHKRGRNTGKMPACTDIADRPAEANERSSVGHWEGDTIIGAQHQGAVVTLVDRKSRFVLLAPTKDCKARRVRHKLQQLLGQLPSEKCRSATFDRGKEFAEHELLTRRLKMPVFFAQPYCPWQRGTNEHTNGLIRQFLPKGTSFKHLSPRRLADVAQKLNHRPRKLLGYLTPSEVFHNQLPCN